jgi:hypothetical protein
VQLKSDWRSEQKLLAPFSCAGIALFSFYGKLTTIAGVPDSIRKTKHLLVLLGKRSG